MHPEMPTAHPGPLSSRTLEPLVAEPTVAEPVVAEPDARVQHVPEAVLQSLWAERRFDVSALQTTQGTSVEILNPGHLNPDSGPDFHGARLRIEGPGGALFWIGDVEVHRTSGEWLLHRHHEDDRYNRVVLHVVLLADRHTGRLRRADGSPLPEIVLDGRLGTSLRELLYRFFANPRPDFPCAARWEEVDDDVKQPWIRELGLLRLRARTAELAAQHSRQADPAQRLYAAVLRALGYSKNAEPMSELARRLPLVHLRRLGTSKDVEAALFGTAGLLPAPTTMQQCDHHAARYVAGLRDRFERLRHRMPFSPMQPLQWQFFRLRPANFPTRRLAQAAALLSPSDETKSAGFLRSGPLRLLRAALAAPDPIGALRALVQAPEPDPFWLEHVRFERPTPACGSAAIGRSRADRILMDALLPVLLHDAELHGTREQRTAALALLEQLPGAEDEVTRLYTPSGGRPQSALTTQGLHQLHRSWCGAGRCLDCAVGQALLRMA